MSLLSIGIASAQRGAPAPVTRNITSASNPSSFSVANNTAFASLGLPTTIVCTLNDSTLIALAVVWSQGTYNQAVAATYILTGTLTLPVDGSITNTTNVTASVSVTVNAAVTYDIYVSPSGNDSNNGLTVGSPKLTIPAAVIAAQALGGARTVKGAAGTFTLQAVYSWPINISFVGAGIDVTNIKIIEAVNGQYVTGSFIYGFDRAALRLESGSLTNGNQTLSDFTLDCSKISNTALRGQNVGINVYQRSNVILKNIKCRKAYFCGFRIDEASNCRITQCEFIDCSYGESAFATGCVMWGDITDVEIDNCDVNEGFGNGMKGFAGDPSYTVTRLKFHDNYISVYPVGQWNGGGAPNIAVEQWGAVAINCEFYNNYLDNNMSLVSNTPLTNGVPTDHVYNNTFDMITRAGGNGYCIETSINYVEVDHNYMIGGSNGTIINFQNSTYPQYGNWNIHHNTIVAPQSFYPSGIVRSENKGVRDVNFYNNTIHILPGNNEQVIGFVTYNTGASTNINCKNNIFIDESTANSQWGENKIAQFAGGVQNFIVDHNYMYGIPVGAVAGGTYTNNFTSNPQITKSGVAPDPYYRPLPGSPVLQAGVNVGLPYTGAAPTIGAYELSGASNSGNIVSVETIPAISLVTGVAWAALQATLPTTSAVTLDDASQVNLTITWAQGTYNSAVEDTYNLIGTLTLVSGVTNSGNKTATIAVTVTEATVVFTDSFDRGSLGGSYTIQGNVTATLDGNDMTMGVTGAAANTDRIIRNTWDDTIDAFKSSVIFSPSDLNSSSIGLAIGIQNAVNPNPNKGVYMLFDTSTLANAGRVSIASGDGTLNNGSFITRISSTGTPLPIIVGRRYLCELQRTIVGSDAVFLALVTDLTTSASVTATWTEIGAVSLGYAQQQVLYQLGGTRIVEDWTVYNLDAVSSSVIVDDIFDRVAIDPWTEIDVGANQITITPNNPYVSLTTVVFANARRMEYPTALGVGLNSWRMTVDFRFTGGNGAGLIIGTINSPLNPNVNLEFLVRISKSASNLRSYIGDATIDPDANSLVNTSAGTLTFTNNLDYRVVLERTYSGSGDSSYLSTVFLIASPGTTITSSYTWTGAPEQALYNSMRWFLSVYDATVQVRRVLIESL